MKNIASDNIIAYPAARRQGKGDLNGILLTESRLSSVVNSLLDINGFVTYPLPGDEIFQEQLDSDKVIKINILGRYFKIFYSTSSPDPLDFEHSSDSVYVGIHIDKTGSEDNELYYEVQGQDDSGKYKGLTVFSYSDISDSISNNDDNTYTVEYTPDGGVLTRYICIKIAEKIDDVWRVPEPEYSKIRFIDAGFIDSPSQE